MRFTENLPNIIDNFPSLGWITLTFFGESVRMITNHETNETLTEVVPRLPLKAWYPFDAMSGTMYIVAFAFQVSILMFSTAKQT